MAFKKKLPQATRADSDRRVRQADRLARLLRILEHIQSRGRWTAKNLALEEECSERTIFRSLQTLELAGVPWYFDESEKCYRVRPDYRFPVLNLTTLELVDHAVTSGVARAAGISGGISAATAKIKTTAAEDALKLLDDADKLISVLGLQMADHSKHHEALRTVQWALLDRKQLVGNYKSPYEDKPVQLRLTPYRLCLIKQAWYLVAAPIDANRPRTYRIARFKTLRRTDASANVPADFDLRNYFGDAWTVFRGETKYHVEIEFSKDAADVVVETNWHGTQQVRRLKDGSVRLRFRVDGLDEIVHWVLSWSGRAKVIQPIELKGLVVRHLQAGIDLNNC